jgi:hypothetical protein
MVDEKKERFLASLGMTKWWGNFPQPVQPCHKLCRLNAALPAGMFGLQWNADFSACGCWRRLIFMEESWLAAGSF